MKIIQFREEDFDELFQKVIDRMKLAVAEAQAEMGSHEPDRYHLNNAFRGLNYEIQTLKQELKKS